MPLPFNLLRNLYHFIIFSVQLWTVNNYHWYLKQNLRFDTGVATARWDPEHAYKMYVMSRAGQLVTYTWSWTTDHTIGVAAQDMSLVTVIDGGELYDIVREQDILMIKCYAT